MVQWWPLDTDSRNLAVGSPLFPSGAKVRRRRRHVRPRGDAPGLASKGQRDRPELLGFASEALRRRTCRRLGGAQTDREPGQGRHRLLRTTQTHT